MCKCFSTKPFDAAVNVAQAAEDINAEQTVRNFRDISRDDLFKCLKNWRSNDAAGLDEVSYKLLKSGKAYDSSPNTETF